MSMTTSFAVKSLSALLFAGVAVGSLAGTASAQTREHILLARQVGVVADAPDEPTESQRVNIRWEKIAVPFA
jgi:hypothetical protein